MKLAALVITGAVAAAFATPAAAAPGAPDIIDQVTQQQARAAAVEVEPAAAEDFIADSVPAAKATQRQYRVPASVALGQAILESNWGKSKLSTESLNFFGFKCTGANEPGPIAVGCKQYDTTECTPTCHPAKAYFRVYSSRTDSFRDYGRLLSTSDRYRAAFKYTDNPDQFIREVHKGGYATDPEYADKVIGLMKRHDLYRHNQVGTDVNGDGRADIVTVKDGKLQYYYGDGSGNFHFQSEAGTDWDKLAHLEAGDIDGDGLADLLGVAGGKLRYYRGDGTGNFHWVHEIGEGWEKFKHVALADVNGDGKADIVGVAGDKLHYYYGDGTGNFHFHSEVGTGWDTLTAFASGDVNGDHKADIVGVAGGALRYYYGDGTGNFHPGSEAGQTWDQLNHLSLGDVDGDAKADILGERLGVLYYFRGDGTGNFHPGSEGGSGWDAMTRFTTS